MDKQDTIVSRIIDGSITIDSLAELENLIKAFPNNPWLHRVFADLLKRDKSFTTKKSVQIVIILLNMT